MKYAQLISMVMLTLLLVSSVIAVPFTDNIIAGIERPNVGIEQIIPTGNELLHSTLFQKHGELTQDLNDVTTSASLLFAQSVVLLNQEGQEIAVLALKEQLLTLQGEVVNIKEISELNKGKSTLYEVQFQEISDKAQDLSNTIQTVVLQLESYTGLSTLETRFNEHETKFEEYEEDYQDYRKKYREAVRDDDSRDIRRYEDKFDDLDDDLKDLTDEVEELVDDASDEDDDRIEEDSEDLIDEIEDLQEKIDNLLNPQEYVTTEIQQPRSIQQSPEPSVILEPLDIPFETQEESSWESIRLLAWLLAGIVILGAVFLYLMALLIKK